MAQDAFQLTGSAAEIYEDQKVPAMFRPLAEATLNAVPLSGDDSILDVACGTGIVARKIRERVGLSARVVGADLNEGMIEAARKLKDPHAQTCEWYVCDVCDMPFDAGEFSIAFCQQGLQFFPDEIAALTEIKRVLRHDGRIALTVWSGPSAFFEALALSLAKYVDESTAERSLAPFGYKGRDTLEVRLGELGFSGTSRHELAVDRVIMNPEVSIRKEILGTPVGPSVEEKGDVVMQQIVQEVTEALSGFRRGSDLVIPQHTHLFQAKLH